MDYGGAGAVAGRLGPEANATGGAVREATSDAVDVLCFLADALTATPECDLEAASRRGLGKILEDVAVMLAEAVMQSNGKGK